MSALESMFMGIGICVVAAVVLTLGFALLKLLYDNVIGNPLKNRLERAKAMEKLAFEQALTLAKLEPSDTDSSKWGRGGVCKAEFKQLRWDALKVIGQERFTEKIDKIRADVNKNGQPTYTSGDSVTYNHG